MGYLEKGEKATLTERLKNLSRRYIENGEVLILTYGGNGYGGLGSLNLDNQTKKFQYLFVSVSNSCEVGDLEEGIAAFNEISTEHLTSKYGDLWKKEINRFLRRKGVKEKI